MNKIDIDKNIIYIEDFISKDHLDLFIDKINSNSRIEDYGHPVHLTLKVDQRDAVDLWFEYIEKLKVMLESTTRKIKISSTEEIDFTKYRDFPLEISDSPSSEYLMQPHQDDASYDWKEDEKGPTFVSHGIVIFITDDFEGGEIVYVNKDISIKPKAGSLLVHPGNLDYAHAVNKFYNGERIVYAGFVHEDRK